jgi:hypothetical protein
VIVNGVLFVADARDREVMHRRGDRSGVVHCQLHRFRGVECVTHADEEPTLGDADMLIGGMEMPSCPSPRAMTTARRSRPT